MPVKVFAGSSGQIDSVNVKSNNQITFACNIKLSAIKFISKLYDNPSVTRNVIQNVVEDTSELISDILTLINRNVTVASDLPSNPLDEFSTEHRRLKYLTNSKYLLKPQPFLIGQIYDDFRRDGVTLGLKHCEGQIVSIRKVLKLFLEVPGVLLEITQYISEETSFKDVALTSLFGSL